MKIILITINNRDYQTTNFKEAVMFAALHNVCRLRWKEYDGEPINHVEMVQPNYTLSEIFNNWKTDFKSL
jgi:hypothetical protein